MKVSQEEFDTITSVNSGPPVDKKITESNNHDEDVTPVHYVPPPLSAACEEVTVRCLLNGGDPFVHYPKIDGTPYSEYDTPFLLTYLFPHLFPGGVGDPTDPHRARPVKLKDAIAHLIHLRYDDPDYPGGYLYPFAEEADFVFYTGNTIHRQSVIQKTQLYFKRNPEHAQLSLDQARNMSKNEQWSQIIKRIGKYTGDVLMSPDYWWKKKGLLTSLRDTVGAFDAFYTFSYCEKYDPYLLRLYKDPRRNKMKNKIPHFLTTFYGQRLASFRKHWTFGVMGAKALWERDEWQQRDFRHTHGMMKLGAKLRMQELHHLAIAGRTAEKKLLTTQHLTVDQKSKLLKVVQDGKDAEPKLIKALDILVSHDHPNGVQPFTRPTEHPCSKTCVDVLDKLNAQQREAHFSNLHSMTGLHYKCTSYCLRKQKDGTMKCKMHFGDDEYKPIIDKTKLHFFEGPDGKLRLRVLYKRNHPKANNINKGQFYGWGHNTDFQPCNDEEAADEYAAKYTAKGVTRSDQWETAADTVMKYADPEDQGRRLLLKTILQSHKGFSSP